jgi:hypothetical protein
MSDTQTFDPSRRRLCPDGSCVGLLDESGRCKECGQVAGAGRAATPAVPLASPAPPEARPEGDGDGAPFDPARRLCADGSCVGVIGADGRCGVCGRTGASLDEE